MLSGHGLLAGLTAAPSIPAAQGLFLKPLGIPQKSSSQSHVLLIDSAEIAFEALESVMLSGQGSLAGLTAAPSIPTAQGLFLKRVGIPQKSDGRDAGRIRPGAV